MPIVKKNITVKRISKKKTKRNNTAKRNSKLSRVQPFQFPKFSHGPINIGTYGKPHNPSSPGKNYSGAGFLLIDDWKQNPHVILFRNRRSRKFNDLGGTIDKQDTNDPYKLEMTAAREGREESKNLLGLRSRDIHKLPYIDLLNAGSYYRCYILVVNEKIRGQYFHHNSHIIDNSSLSHVWKETDDMARFPLHRILQCVNSTMGPNDTCSDSHNRLLMIGHRAKFMLKHLPQAGPIRPICKLKMTKDKQLLNTNSMICI